LKAAEVCQKQAEAVPEKPATSRLFNNTTLCNIRLFCLTIGQAHTSAHPLAFAVAIFITLSCNPVSNSSILLSEITVIVCFAALR
jgi:hypothetical protein